MPAVWQLAIPGWVLIVITQSDETTNLILAEINDLSNTGLENIMQLIEYNAAKLSKFFLRSVRPFATTTD